MDGQQTTTNTQKFVCHAPHGIRNTKGKKNAQKKKEEKMTMSHIPYTMPTFLFFVSYVHIFDCHVSKSI